MKVEIPDKICSHCGGTTWRERIINGKPTYYCYNRLKTVAKRSSINNRERNNAYQREWAKANPDKVRKSQEKQYTKKVVRLKELYRKRKEDPVQHALMLANSSRNLKKRVAQLSDGYIRGLGFTKGIEFTPEQIEKYRTYLKTLRQWKSLQSVN
jgi:hypothetical protein